ncbi:amidohydrolase family protein [Candidatus Saccharibacteria bacterium]|nr:amidohydrolase family protein [Candidatus Saccharibacteria bacterium]
MIKPGSKITIPSPIDVHAHLREPGGEAQETIESGTRAALVGGYQAVFDMPNNPNGQQTWSAERLEDKIARAKKTAQTDIGFYAGVDLENPALEEFPAMAEKAVGLKLYMGPTTGNAKVHDLDIARPAIDAWIAACRDLENPRPIMLHVREELGAETVRYIAGQGFPVHWCHISTASEIAMARQLRAKYGDNFTCGATLHHLTMTARNADYQQGWNGARMQPPLGDEKDAAILLAALNDGTVQMLETDHAPHTLANKLKAETENPRGLLDADQTTCYGVGGLEFVLPVMTALVQRDLISLERLVDALYDQPIKLLRLDRSKLTGETVLEFRPYVIGRDDLFSKSSNVPYIGWTAGARVISVKRGGKEFDPRSATEETTDLPTIQIFP